MECVEELESDYLELMRKGLKVIDQVIFETAGRVGFFAT